MNGLPNTRKPMPMKKLALAACLIVYQSAQLYAQASQAWDAQPLGATPQTSASVLEEADNQRAAAVKLFGESKYDAAVAAAKRAAELFEQADGGESAETAKALSLLAYYYDFTGQVNQAEPLFRRAVSIWEKKHGAESVDYFDALRRYASLLHRKKRDDAAEKFGRRASELGARLKVWEHATAKTG
ncbi:MAG: tetratricopeptide repeat protein, partial [Acidobacteria bacterium]|nr:tetratricopeptide repeat protein [Acidobacteriota bacterium]